MSKVYFKRYLHSDKSDNRDIAKHFDDDNLRYVNYEVEILIEYDTETRKFKITGCDGLFLGEESYTAEDMVKIPEEE